MDQGNLSTAIACYRRALDLQPQLAGAHYGLAFLLLKRGDARGAQLHLEQFLSGPPRGPESDRWIRHAQLALEQLRSGGTGDIDPESARRSILDDRDLGDSNAPIDAGI